MTASEARMFYGTFQEHKHREGTAIRVDMWLCTNRPVLLLCKHQAKAKRGASVEEEDDEYSEGSVDDEESIGSMLVDPEDTLAEFFSSLI